MADDWNFWRVGLLGAIAGLIGGFVMWVFMTIVTTLNGQGFWAMPKWVGDVVTGDSWLGFNATDVFTGLAIHLVVAAILGVIFALIAVPFIATPRVLLAAGVVWGLVVWLVLSVVALGAVDVTMAQEAPVIPWFIANVLFGIAAALVVIPLRTATMRV